MAELARGSLRRKLPALRQALTGRFKPHQAFRLSRLLVDLDNLEESMAAIAQRIEEQLGPFRRAA